MDQLQYQSTDVPAKDKVKIAELLTHAQDYEADEIKSAVQMPNEPGWWYGTYLNEKLDAIAYMNDRTVQLFAKDCTAMTHLGMSLSRSLGKRSSGETHSAFGPEDIVSAFWQGFKSTGKAVLGDIRLNLLRLQKLDYKLNDAYGARVATAKDQALVVEFLGESLIEVVGVDMRRVAREALEKNCAELIANERIILGSQRGKPVFLMQRKDTDRAIFLEQLFFPIPMRRPRVMTGTLAQLSAMLLAENKELLVYVDVNKKDLHQAFIDLGYEKLRSCRLIRMR
ncbi:MAG: hypothetical protein WC966_11560 [Bradymonadales bacterium]|jgi:hypothetical protein